MWALHETCEFESQQEIFSCTQERVRSRSDCAKLKAAHLRLAQTSRHQEDKETRVPRTRRTKPDQWNPQLHPQLSWLWHHTG